MEEDKKKIRSRSIKAAHFCSARIEQSWGGISRSITAKKDALVSRIRSRSTNLHIKNQTDKIAFSRFAASAGKNSLVRQSAAHAGWDDASMITAEAEVQQRGRVAANARVR